MRFRVNKRKTNFESKYPKQDRDLAKKFSKLIYNELGDFISAVVLFGSAAKGTSTKDSDVDILIIIDDVHIDLSKEIVETYRILIQKAVAKVNAKRLHVQSLKLSAFWEYTRAGDPVAINILRDGIAFIDRGFFEPLQILLLNGRIRPSREAVQTYVNMAYSSLNLSKSNVDTAIVDLYWACIDSAHAALMSRGEVPVSPSQVADELNKKLVKNKLLEKRYVDIMSHMYELSKKILKREVSNLSGKEYDKYFKYTDDFVNRMTKIVKTI